MDKKVGRFKGMVCSIIIFFFCFAGSAAFANKDHVGKTPLSNAYLVKKKVYMANNSHKKNCKEKAEEYCKKKDNEWKDPITKTTKREDCIERQIKRCKEKKTY
jgi:hypothetical protein